MRHMKGNASERISRREALGMIAGIAASAGGFCLSGCGPEIETSEEIYEGVLPAYGLTELKLYTRQDTGEVYAARFKAEKHDNFALYEVNGISFDEGVLTFSHARKFNSDIFGSPTTDIYKSSKGFEELREAVRMAFDCREIYLKKRKLKPDDGDINLIMAPEL